MYNNYVYIAVAFAVIYLIRVLPLTLIRRPIKSRFIRSFLHYVPYVTLAVMTFPAILESTQSPVSAWLALGAGLARPERTGLLRFIPFASFSCGNGRGCVGRSPACSWRSRDRPRASVRPEQRLSPRRPLRRRSRDIPPARSPSPADGFWR